MIYLIGGAPRVGKSQFMQKVIERQPMPGLSCDFLYEIEQVKKISGFSGAGILEKGRLFYPVFKQLLVDVNRRAEDCVIDGEVILPEFIPELSEKYDVKCCFLGLSSTNLETILRHGGYFNWPQWKLENNLGHEVEKLAERTVERSAIIREEAQKYGLPYFDFADDYKNTSEAALLELLR